MTMRVRAVKGVSGGGRSCLSILAAAGLVGLAACGPSGGGANSAASGQSFSQAMHAAFDKRFNEAFAKSAHDSCISSSTAHGATPGQAEQYCTCVVTQLAPLSVQEKQQLSPSSDKFTQIRELCRAQVH